MYPSDEWFQQVCPLKKDRIHAWSDNNRVIDLKKPEPFFDHILLIFRQDARKRQQIEIRRGIAMIALQAAVMTDDVKRLTRMGPIDIQESNFAALSA